MRIFELTVFCEGQTERDFVVRILSPHLKQFQVFAKPEMKKVGGQETGVSSWGDVYGFLRKHVGRARPHQFFTTMIDYYGFRHSFDIPGGGTPSENIIAIETSMEAHIASQKFIAYLQLHEFEALLFADLRQIPRSFPDQPALVKQAVSSLAAEVSGVPPEDIDDGAATAPSKRLIRAIPGYERLRAVVGPQVVERIGIHNVRVQCPHFHRWVARLEAIATGTSDQAPPPP